MAFSGPGQGYMGDAKSCLVSSFPVKRNETYLCTFPLLGCEIDDWQRKMAVCCQRSIGTICLCLLNLLAIRCLQLWCQPMGPLCLWQCFLYLRPPSPLVMEPLPLMYMVDLFFLAHSVINIIPMMCICISGKLCLWAVFDPCRGDLIMLWGGWGILVPRPGATPSHICLPWAHLSWWPVWQYASCAKNSWV